MRFIISLLLFSSYSALAIRGDLNSDQNLISRLKSKAVELQRKQEDGSYLTFCSASIYNKKTVLTAAHCFDNKNFDFRIKYGNHFLTYSQVLISKKYKRVDVYDDFWQYLLEVKLFNDFALISLKDEIDVNNQFMKTNDEFDFKEIYISGFGYKYSMFGDGLKEELGIFRVSTPLSFIRRDDSLYQDGGNSGACLADSGGPVFTIKNDVVYQIGVVSMSDCLVWSKVQPINLDLIDSSEYEVFKHE